jgi:type IV pilus assembly protein PilN
MIRINLLPLKETERAIGRRQQVSMLALGVTIALLIMIVPFLVQGRRLATLDTQIDELNREIQQYNTQVKEVRDLERLKKELQTKLQVIQDLNRKRGGPSHVLDDLSASTPDNLWLIDFSETGGQATVTGLALDNETIARFMRQMQDSPYFHAVDLVETSRTNPQAPAGLSTGSPASFTRFIVKASIDYFGRDGKPAEAPAANSPTQPAAAKPPAVVAQEPKA